MTREEKRALWNQRIASYRTSGLNAEQWCSMHELSLATLRYWLGRQNRQPAKPEPVEVQWLLLDEAPSSSHGRIGGIEEDVRIQVGRTSVVLAVTSRKKPWHEFSKCFTHMLDFDSGTKVYLACGSTDLRKGFEGLKLIIKLNHKLDPYSKSMFVFCNRSRTTMNILQWDGSGLLCS